MKKENSEHTFSSQNIIPVFGYLQLANRSEQADIYPNGVKNMQ